MFVLELNIWHDVSLLPTMEFYLEMGDQKFEMVLCFTTMDRILTFGNNRASHPLKIYQTKSRDGLDSHEHMDSDQCYTEQGKHTQTNKIVHDFLI